jgi:UDP-4-amino-4,6-dideoxy-N-acetyl-beta-L-altrosamine transaminase
MKTKNEKAPLKRLPYGRQWVDEDDIAAVVDILRSNWLTQGPTVAEFEKSLTDYCGAKYAVAVNSGTSALHIASLAAGVGKGDVGITSPITFVASANCIAYCGGTPKFADINPATINIDVDALEKVCEKDNPKVIIPVDFAGQPADLPRIKRIAEKYGAMVIEDAAHSLGAGYTDDGIKYKAASCAHTDMAILSFHPVKHITTGEGGAVLTNDFDLYERLLELRSHGIAKFPERVIHNEGAWWYEQQKLGFNYRITDIQCALGISQMRKLDSFIERRRELVEIYKETFAAMNIDACLLTEAREKKSSYHLLVAMISGGLERRKRVFNELRSNNIWTQVHYIPVHFQPWYQETYGYREGDYPNAESYYGSCMSLPLFPAMEDADVVRVAEAFDQILKNEK